MSTITQLTTVPADQIGVYVYTILDRATGQVLVQIPREELVKIGSNPTYTAGQVLDTKV